MPISTIGSNSLNQTSDLTINGVTVGKGGGAVSTNTAVGASALSGNSSNGKNTAVGYQALQNNNAISNTAVGYLALATKTSSGDYCTAVGDRALYLNTSGGSNTAVGGLAGYSNTTGISNTALGEEALFSNTTASNNTAVGYQALYTNATGATITAVGHQAARVTTVNDGTFIGAFSGNSATTGATNTFLGYGSGYYVTTGAKNTIIGAYTGNQGGLDIRTSSNNIVLSDGDGNPRFYHNGTYWTIPSGPLLVPYIYATTGAGAGTVVVGTDGNLFRSSSSARYKKDIVDARYGLSDLLKLRAVNYKGNGEQDTDKLLGGLIAEEVDEAGLQEFVIYDDQQRPDALHYAQMVSLCVKAIQELKTIVDAQAAEIAELKAKVA